MKIQTGMLKITLIVISMIVLLISYLLTLGLISSLRDNDIYFIKILFYSVLYLALFNSFIVISLVYKILLLIDKDILFTFQAIQKVILIKRISVLTFLFLLGIMPMVFHIVRLTNFTGIIPFAIIINISPLILSTFVGVMEKLLKKMIQIKSENDLTV
ncbi:DUF2975 domain-containing protein [Lactococcus lactis]|uniref:DUF2975 domain-containing protein n=1 Tax=Lactococcus lactis TaxID=1358 RepID=UPI0035BC896F